MCRCFIACINGCFIVGDGSLCPSRRGLLGLLAQTSKSPPAVSSLSMCRQKKLQLLVCANFIFSKKGQKTAPFCVVKRTVGKRSFGYSVCSFLFSLPLRGRFASGAKSLAGFAEKRVRGGPQCGGRSLLKTPSVTTSSCQLPLGGSL